VNRAQYLGRALLGDEACVGNVGSHVCDGATQQAAVKEKGSDGRHLRPRQLHAFCNSLHVGTVCAQRGQVVAGCDTCLNRVRGAAQAPETLAALLEPA
jgi:hypothetical protein